MEPGEDAGLDAQVAVPGARLGSPEDPFLYELVVTTPGDQAQATFGMRTFRFDPTTRRALLDEHPYPLRGTNFTFHRPIEDAERAALLGDEAWARKVVRGAKAMHGNAARTSIGLPWGPIVEVRAHRRRRRSTCRSTRPTSGCPRLGSREMPEFTSQGPPARTAA